MSDQDAFADGIREGKRLMLARMFALSRMLTDSGDATPYLNHFLRQIAREERIDVDYLAGGNQVVRPPVEPGVLLTGSDGPDPDREDVPEVRSEDH